MENAEIDRRRRSTVPLAGATDGPRHSAVVRVTHWLNAASFLGLLVSGIAILLAHPRLYWGETGAVGGPSLVDLPLPFVYGHSGWGRHLHFLCAWIAVPTAAVYLICGFSTRHVREQLLPAKADLTWGRIARVIADRARFARRSGDSLLRYNVLQQLAYLAVIFLLFPLMLWTGLAMSPAVTSVWPGTVEVLGGQQSARTLHFVAANLLVLFLVVHIAALLAAGFSARVRAMVTGRVSVEPP